MYNIFALLCGVLTAISVFLNGQLTALYGSYIATLFVHITGLIFAFIFTKIAKQKIFPNDKLPFWFYLGGAIGVLSILLPNFSFGKISVTNILALAFFGQTVMSLIVDNFGLFGMKKHPLKKSSFVGFTFSIIGVLLMLDLSNAFNISVILAIFLAFATGFTSVTSRAINARLSEHIGGMAGSYINHLVGLPVALAFVLIIPGNDLALLFQKPAPEFWIYLGGLTGVLLVYTLNLTVRNIPALRLSLLSFVGKISVGTIIDSLLDIEFSRSSFYGGLIVAAGVVLNLLMEYFQKKRELKT